MLHVSMVGCGAIGRGVLELLKSDPDVVFDVVIVPAGTMDEARGALSALAPNVRVATGLAEGDRRPDLLVECAGHRALEEHIVPALERGIPCMVVSVGALPSKITVASVRASRSNSSAAGVPAQARAGLRPV